MATPSQAVRWIMCWTLSGILHQENIRQHQPLQHLLPVGLHISHDTGRTPFPSSSSSSGLLKCYSHNNVPGCHILHTEVYLAINGGWTHVIPGQGGPRFVFYIWQFTRLHPFVFAARVIEDAEEKQAVLLKNYLDYVHNKFNKYAFCFFFCELLNICISISQVERSNNKNNLGGQTK